MTNHDYPAPPNGRTLDRRRLLADASILTGGALAAAVLGPEIASASGAKTARPVIWLNQSPTAASPIASPGATPIADLATYVPNHLTEAELTTLKAVLDRIIPEDEYGPSANQMGVFVYIDKSFGGLHADEKPALLAGATLPAFNVRIERLPAAQVEIANAEVRAIGELERLIERRQQRLINVVKDSRH